MALALAGGTVTLHAADNFLLQDSAGDTIGSGASGTLGAKVSEAETTQLVTVGVDETVGTGETVRFTISSSSNSEATILQEDGSAVTLTTQEFELTEDDSALNFLVQGVDDTDSDGEGSEVFTFEVTASTVAGISVSRQYALTVNNSDNEGTSGNTAPSEPTQRYPTNGSEIATDESLQWEHAYDADSDTLTYQVCVGRENADVDTCISVDDDQIVAGSGVASVSWPVLLALALSFLLFRFGRRSRRTKATHIIQFAPQKTKKLPSALSVFALMFLVACGNTALLDALDVSPRPSVQVSLSSFSNVTAGNTYNWRVYADDGNGNVTPASSEFSFEVTSP